MKKLGKSKKYSFFKKYSKTKSLFKIKRDKVVEMSDKFNIVEVIIIIFISIVFGAVVGYVLSSSRTFGIEVSPEVQEIITTYDSIVDNYYGEVDEDELLNSAVSGMIDTLDDPYSIFMDSNDSESFNQTVDGSFVGIGITVEWLDNKFKIVKVLDNSPASKVGLEVNDYIVKIDDISVDNLTLDDVSKLIQGKKGTKVFVSVLRGEKEKKYEIKRDVVEIVSVTSKIMDNDIGYIRIENFSSNTAEQFENCLERIEDIGIESLIIDVRDNPGGRLGQVNDILELFFKKKVILYQIGNKDKVEKIYSEKSNHRTYPIVVLVNSASASASEILAASLKDNYKKSIIVGTRTYGKGTIQKAFSLSSGASIKYTTQQWLTPNGKWLNEIGVVPDIEVELNDEYLGDSTEENDNQLSKAIEILKK